MRLNAPKKIVWTLALIAGIIGVIGYFLPIPVLSTVGFVLVAAAWLLLVLASVLKGL